ncbi:structural protein [Synechococcus phage S-CRM01]|uniref:structural protein n=1 Tax=Synechococcus phage S-CRM01 TaxID=1026955 RepID=UPI000209E333|nr:structural protein [Synechococcus phage S-CRM01]AEC52957.1 structural protein [Synechococcus phage S-CRM01]
MPVQQNLNVSPYYDDFDPNKNYYSTLFKPGFPLQARELTGLQSCISDQIEQLASKFLSPGDVVTPGEYAYAKPVAYVKIRSTTGNINNYVGATLTGVTSGVTAKVIHVVEATENDSITFFVSYNSAGTSNIAKTFQEGETLNSDTPDALIAVVGVNGVDKPINFPAMGFGSLFSVTNGSYFINGFMVRNYEQTIVVSKYITTPSCQIGFIVTESFVTSNEDTSLLDNSQGSSNFAAPGADRLKIELTLTKLDLGVTIPNFIRLATIIQGNIQGSPTQTIKWDWLFDILARRTFNESGDYIVKDFTIQPMEYPNSDELDGLFDPDVDNLYPPVPDSGNVDLLTYEEADVNYVLNVSDGLAYVQGYEVGFDSSFYKFGEKSRSTQFRNNASLNITDGPFFYVSKVYGTPDIQNITSGGSAIALSSITLYGNFTDGYTGNALVSGTSIPQNLGNAPQTTYHIVCDGPVGQTQFNEVYKGGTSVVVTGNNVSIRRGDFLDNVRVLSAITIPAIPTGIITPKYFQPSNPVGTDTFYEYNSEYKLGYSTVQYFTHIPVTLDLQTGTNWVVGSIVTGENSGATGVVEDSINQEDLGYIILVLSNTNGEFIPGEGISQGTKSAVIFRDGEISGFTFTDAGFDGQQFDLSGETSIAVTSLGATTNLTTADGEIITSPTRITLTAKGRDKLLARPENNIDSGARKINYNVRTTPNQINGYAIIPSVSIKNSAVTTKSFYSPLFGPNDFSADISGENSSHIESFIVTSGGTFTGKANSNFINSDNYSGDTSKELNFGDIISFVDDEGNAITKQVLFATEPSGYGSLRTPAYIYFTTTLTDNVTGKQVVRIRSKKFGNSSDNLIYQLPQKVVKTLEGAPLSTDIRYQAFRQFYVPFSAGATFITITTTDPNEQFVPGSNTTVAIAENTTNGIPYLEGRFLLPTGFSTLDDGKKLVINLDPLIDSVLLKVITTVSVTDVRAKKKILVKYQNGSTDERIFIPAADAAKSVLSLGRTDVFKLYSVVTPDGLDVTDNYTFDDGQRDNIYDISRLILKANRPAAVTDLYVTCDAFDHTTDGDFFSVDSYTHDLGISYKKIPIYSISSAIPDQQQSESSSILELRDCVDFRPSVNGAAPTPSRIPGISGVNSFAARNFRNSTLGGNADVPRFLVPGSLFSCDIEYYLARIDTLFLDRTGELRLTQGVPDLNPKAPNDESTSIRLYDLRLPPYTFSAEDIYIKKYNYRRYTMRDISSLDRRIQRVEDYVSLSLLEQSALNAQVRDSVTGLDRFKNGFVVDSFANHANGNTTSEEYRCSIDPVSDHLRPPHFTEQVALEEVNQLNSQRLSNFYRKTGPLLTLPYTSVDFIQNPFATRTVNLQPFSVFVYDGEVKLEPSVDTWQEVRRRDKLVIEDNSLYNSMVDMTNNLVSMGLGTVWGDWETTSSQVIPGGIISFAEAQRRGLSIQDGGGSLPFTSRPVNVSSTTVLNQSRSEFRIGVNPATSTTVQTSQGDRIVDTQVAKTMRSTAVFFYAYRLKPNAKYYAFFDGIDVNAWVSPDEPTTLEEDGSKRFVNRANTNPKGFGAEIISDNVGTITGVFLIPNGHAPVNGTTFNGDMGAVQYDNSSPIRNFDVGTRSFRLTTNPTNGADVDAFGESGFTSSGVIIDKQETIISTRVPNVERISTGRTQAQQVRTGPVPTASAFDPVAQTFLIDNNNPEGVFVTELDVFFKTKDENESVLAYLVSTEGQVPTEDIIPFSLVEKNPDSILRVICTLAAQTQVTLPAGTIIVGKTSGARGVLKNTIDFDSASLDPTRNVQNTVYNVILSNYLNEFIPGEVIVPEVTPALLSTFVIANDEISVSRIDVTKLGDGYTFATVEFAEPQLPGGVPPTATAVISKGKIVKVNIETIGRGYTQIPTAIINGDGNGAELYVRVVENRAAVDMGVAVSDDATAPTRFKFEAPVYLLGNTNYAFVLKSPNSVEYTAYISKLGENILGTETRVTQQPLLGSIFRSQNGGLWTEDQTEDIKFVLRRAEFTTNTNSQIRLENSPLGMEPMDPDPIETSANLNPDPANETNEFGNNPKIVRAYKKTHGHLPGDYAYIEGIQGYGSQNEINGIPVDEINGLHEVLTAEFNTFTFKVDTAATSSGKAGGPGGMCNYNRPFEVINIRTGSLLFKNTTNSIVVRSAGCASINGNGQAPYILSAPVSVPGEISFYYNNPKQCAHYLNEVKYSNDSFLQNRKSLNVTLNLQTSDSKISPVFDFDRTNAVLAHSLVNRPTESNPSNGTPTRILTFDGSPGTDGPFTLAPNDILILPTGNIIVDSWNPLTRKLKVRGQNTLSITPDIEIRDSLGALLPINIVNVSNVSYPYFIPETQQDGSVFAKWISREFKLENPSDGLEVKITGIMYENDSIRLYYRPRNEEFDGNLTDVNWIPFNGNGLCNNNTQIRVRSSDIVDPRQLSANDWTEYTWSAQGIPQFSGFALKIVLTASNVAKVPLIDDLRAIASE